MQDGRTTTYSGIQLAAGGDCMPIIRTGEGAEGLDGGEGDGEGGVGVGAPPELCNLTPSTMEATNVPAKATASNAMMRFFVLLPAAGGTMSGSRSMATRATATSEWIKRNGSPLVSTSN